jgi:hypothetical protein
LQQALEKRTANLAHDRAPLDTNEQRAQSEYDLYTGPQGRYQQDYGRSSGSSGFPSRGRTRTVRTRSRAPAARTISSGSTPRASDGSKRRRAATTRPPRPAAQQGSLTNPYKLVKTKRGTRRLYSTGYLTARR